MQLHYVQQTSCPPHIGLSLRPLGVWVTECLLMLCLGAMGSYRS